MTDRGLMRGFELWWVFAFEKKFDGKRNHTEIVREVCDRWHIERSVAYENLGKVNSLLAPQLKACGDDLFALIGRIQSSIKSPAQGGEPVVEVDLDSGKVTHLKGWEDALRASLEQCGFDEHPAQYLKAMIDTMKSEMRFLTAERKELDKKIATLESHLRRFRGRGRPPN